MVSRRHLLTIAACGVIVPFARADTGPKVAVTRQLVSQVILPAYAKLVETTRAQDKLWAEFVKAPQPDAVAGLKQAYSAAADAWSAIEFLHFGPAGEEFRSERISYWPERKNATAKALTLLLAGTGDEGLAANVFAKSSAAGQGLPALERLLFDGDDAVPLLLAANAEGDRRRRIGLAIARNIDIIATELIAGWRDGDQALTKRLDEAAFAEEATVRIATDLLALYQLIRDTKLMAVIGKDISSARPHLAEGWRSQRSIKAIAANLTTLQQAVDIILADSNAEVASPSVLRSTLRIAEGLTGRDLAELVTTPKDRSDAILLLDAVTSARDSSYAEIPNALGITLGFNSLDGD
jgi:uncharacterized protein